MLECGMDRPRYTMEPWDVLLAAMPIECKNQHPISKMHQFILIEGVTAVNVVKILAPSS